MVWYESIGDETRKHICTTTRTTSAPIDTKPYLYCPYDNPRISSDDVSSYYCSRAVFSLYRTSNHVRQSALVATALLGFDMLQLRMMMVIMTMTMMILTMLHVLLLPLHVQVHFGRF